MQKHLQTWMVLLIVMLLAACRPSGVEPTKTADTQATIEAAVGATSTAQAEIDVQDQEGESATSAPATAEEIPQGYDELSEEELAVLIDEHVEETMAASAELNSAAEAATADGTLTQEESDELETYVYDLAESVAITEEAVYVYYDLYGELAEETLDLLAEVEDDLVEIAELTIELLEMMTEIEGRLNQGLEVAVELMEQFDSTAAGALEQISGIKGKSDDWVAEVQQEIENRVANLENLTPTEIPGNRIDAILIAFDYVDAVREALLDRTLDLDELRQIGQVGINAKAGLEAYGRPRFQGLSGNIGEISGQLARGQVSTATIGLNALEGALGSRPSR